MASLFRREYKVKAEDAAIEAESRVERDLARWDAIVPAALEKMSSSIGDIRVAALRTIVYQMTGQYLGSAIDDLASDLIDQINTIIEENSSREEHDIAIFAACSICLQLLDNFEPYAMVILNDQMPQLADCENECLLRFFGIGFMTAFGTQDETRKRVLTRFIQLLMNKKARGVDFSPAMTMEAVDAVALILSVVPVDMCMEMLEDIEALIDRCMASEKAKVILSGLELVLVLWDAMKEFEGVMRADDEKEAAKFLGEEKRFIGKYSGKMGQLPGQVSKKNHQKEVRAKCTEVEKVLNGEEQCTLELVLDSQQVVIEGARNLCLTSAVKRVTQHHFAQQMSSNSGLHAIFRFELMSRHAALRMKKQLKDEMRSDRQMTKKERQQDRSKKRRQKAARTECNDD